MAYVSQGGSDSNPCTLDLPCLTIGHAMTAFAGLHDGGSYVGTTVMIGSGTYSESIAWLPSVFLVGWDPDGGENGNVYISGPVTISSSWDSYSGNCYLGTCHLGASNLYFASSVTITDVHAAGGIQVGWFNVGFGGAYSQTGNAAARDEFIPILSSFFGAVTIEGIANAQPNWSFFYANASVASSPTTGSDAGSLAALFQDHNGVYRSNLALHGLVNTNTVKLLGSSEAAFPATITYTNGGTACAALTQVPSSTVTYTAAVPSNWATSPPTTVSAALDRIAANTGNSHPIP
jgi:hypothetical protein